MPKTSNANMMEQIKSSTGLYLSLSDRAITTEDKQLISMVKSAGKPLYIDMQHMEASQRKQKIDELAGTIGIAVDGDMVMYSTSFEGTQYIDVIPSSGLEDNTTLAIEKTIELIANSESAKATA